VIIRSLFGVTVGFILAAAPKIVLETVPAHLLGYGFGSFANIFTFFFVSIVVTLNLINTTIMNTHGYLVIYLAPIPFTIIANLGLWFFWAGETATHIIENHNCPECERLGKRCPMCKDHI
jgi:MFS family permease